MASVWINPQFIRFLLGEDEFDDTVDMIDVEPREGWLRYDLGDDQQLEERRII